MKKRTVTINKYHVEVSDPYGRIIMETDVPFTEHDELVKTCNELAYLWNAHWLSVWRGRLVMSYRKKLINSNHEYRWEALLDEPVYDEDMYHLKY